MGSFKNVADQYDSYFETNDKIFQSELMAIQELSKNIDMSKALEIGIGTGYFATHLGIKEGIEPCKEMAAYAIKRGLNIIDSTIEDYLTDKKYDSLFMITVDCFLKDLKSVFNKINSILSNKGTFIFAFLDKGTPLGEMYEKNKDESESYRGSIFRTYNEMKDLLNETGFQIIDNVETVFDLENKIQPFRHSNGKGIFQVIKARKKED